jgi:hypothetical protein
MSIREIILGRTVEKLDTIPEIKTIRRYPIISPKELEEIAHTQFPLITVIGGLPLPESGNPIQLGAESHESSLRSNLDIYLSVFGFNRETPDTEISSLFDKIYRVLYCDPEYKGFDHTSYETNANVYTDEIVYTTENITDEDYRHKFYKRFTTRIGLDLSDEDYSDSLHWQPILNLTPVTNYIEVSPSSIVEFKNPYFLFRIRLLTNYTHYTFTS